jgi:hypothetical protein
MLKPPRNIRDPPLRIMAPKPFETLSCHRLILDNPWAINPSALPYPPHLRRLRWALSFLTVAALIILAMLEARTVVGAEPYWPPLRAADGSAIAEPVAPKLPALKAKPHYVIGRAVDASGNPLSNVTIHFRAPP